jgi:rubrerythrin
MERDEFFKAFKLAIEGEEQALSQYARLAEAVDDEELKALFSRFAEEEGLHREQLLEAYEQFKKLCCS